MPKHPYSIPLEAVFLAIAAGFLLAGIAALTGFPGLSPAVVTFITFLSSLAVLTSFFGLLFLGRFRRWVGSCIWKGVMRIWAKGQPIHRMPQFSFDPDLSADDLQQLVVRTYTRIGYTVLELDGSEQARPWIKMINPLGDIELVHCQPCQVPLQVPQVQIAHFLLKREQAIRGHIWAPGGFSDEAVQWVKNRPLILADRRTISRLVECACQPLFLLWLWGVG